MNAQHDRTPLVDDVDDEPTPEELAAQWEAEGPPPAGRIANAAASAVALVVGAAGLLLAWGLGVGSPSRPGPGLWPFAISTAIVVLALAQAAAGRRGGGGERFSRYSWSSALGLATLAAMVFLVPAIGFEIPAVLLCLVWMRVLGGETWRSAVLYSVLVTAGFYAIFVLALGTSVPHLF